MNIIQFSMPSPSSGFTGEDLRTFRRWDAGLNRVEIDDGAHAESSGQFAMIYEGDNAWASWGIGREGGQVVLWDCISLQTLGSFSSVRAALAAVPGASEPSGWQPPAEVIQLRPYMTPPGPAMVSAALSLQQ